MQARRADRTIALAEGQGHVGNEFGKPCKGAVIGGGPVMSPRWGFWLFVLPTLACGQGYRTALLRS